MSGFEIFGAVAAALATADLALRYLKYIRDTGEAPAQVVDLYNSLLSFRIKWKTFKQSWLISDSTPDRFFKVTWGVQDDRWKDVLAQCLSIAGLCDKIEGVLQKLVRSSDITQSAEVQRRRQANRERIRTLRRAAFGGGSGRQTPSSAAGVISTLALPRGPPVIGDFVSDDQVRQLEHAAAEAMSAGRKAQFVVSHSKDLTALTTELHARYDRLFSTARFYYAQTHPNATEVDSEEQKQLVLSTAQDLDTVTDTRDASEALYQGASSLLAAADLRHQLQPGIELRIFTENQEAQSKLHYRLTLQGPPPEIMIVEGPVPVTQPGRTVTTPDFQSAYQQVRQENTALEFHV